MVDTPVVNEAVRVENHGAVRQLVFCRAEEFNTITPTLRDELSDALDEAEQDNQVRVVLITAEGPAFCAGFGLDWSTPSRSRTKRPRASGTRWRTCG